MVDKTRSKRNGPIASSVTPTEDHTAVSATQTTQDYNSDRADPSKDRSNLTLLLAALVLDAEGNLVRTDAQKSAIEAAYQNNRALIEQLNNEDTDASIANYESNPSNYSSGITYSGDGTFIPGMPSNAGSPTVRFGDMPRIAVGEKQDRVNSVLEDAARSNGISIATMRGMWHVESRFSSIREVSSTGCSGPWQFTRGTWGEMMIKHGDEIAQRLNAQGFTEDAAIALRYHQALVRGDIRVNDAGLQQQRFNGRISTYAAAHYMKDIAERRGIDANDPRNGGQLYAAYNVGEGSLRKLQTLVRNGSNESAMGELGRVARLNPMFYQNGATASQALGNYQAAVENGTRQYANAFGAEPSVRLAATARTENTPARTTQREVASTEVNQVPALRNVFGNANNEIRVTGVLDQAADAARNVVSAGRQFVQNFDFKPPWA